MNSQDQYDTETAKQNAQTAAVNQRTAKLNLWFTLVKYLGAAVLVLLGGSLANNRLPDAVRPYSPITHVQKWVAAPAAPKGYGVVADTLEAIPRDTLFSRSRGQSALLTLDKRVTFSVDSDNGKYSHEMRSVQVMVGNKSRQAVVGGHFAVPGTDCSVWIYKIDHENDRYSFHLRPDTSDE